MKTKTPSIKTKGTRKIQRKKTKFMLLQVLESHDILQNILRLKENSVSMSYSEQNNSNIDTCVCVCVYFVMWFVIA